MSRLLASLAATALVSLAVLAQPPQPFTVLTADSGASFSDLHVAMRDTGTCDIFYVRTLTDGHQRVEHAVVLPTFEWIDFGPETLLFDTLWTEEIGDAQGDNDGWALIAYQNGRSRTSRYSHQTWALSGGNQLAHVARLDSGYEFPMGCNGYHNSVFTIRRMESGNLTTSWIRSGCQDAGGFSEPFNELMITLLSSSMTVLSQDRCCGYVLTYGPTDNCSVPLPGDRVLSVIEGTGGSAFTLFPFRDEPPHSLAAYPLDGYLYSRDLRRTHGGRFFVVATNWDATGAHLVEVDTVGTCSTAAAFDLSGALAAVAWHPDFGFAALQTNPQLIMLARLDTNGAPVQPLGVFYEGLSHAIREANVAVASDGRVVVLWTESEAGSQAPTLLKMAYVGWSTFLGVDDPRVIPQPSNFILAAFPNPFNPRTELRFSLSEAGETVLRVYDIQGRLTQELIRGRLERGEHQVAFDAGELPSGLYFARLSAGHKQATQKLLLVR